MTKPDLKTLEDKPLFIPLNAEFYDAFEDGSKTTEYRLYGKRWNVVTCYPERKVILSRGYGKKNRLSGVVSDVRTRSLEDFNDKLQASFVKIYNLAEGVNPTIICIDIKQIERVYL